MKIIFPLSCIIIAVVLFFAVIDPMYSDVRQLRADVATYNVALSNSTELQKTRDSLINVYKNVSREDKDKLEHLLPSSINNIGLILEIEKIANLHGMPIGNIQFDVKNLQSKGNANATGGENSIVVAEGNPDQYLPYGIFPMEFEIEGRYDNFLLFLKDLELNLRVVDIQNVSFKVPANSVIQGGTADPNVYSYTLKVNTYWLK